MEGADKVPKWAVALRSYLEKNASLKRMVALLSSVIIPIALTILQFDAQLHISKEVALSGVVALAGVAIFLGLVFIFTEISSGELTADLVDAQRQNAELMARERQLRTNRTRMREAHAAQLARVAGLETLRQRLSGILGMVLVLRHKGEEVEVKSAVGLFLHELAQVGADLFGWKASEQWSVAVYLWIPETRELVCHGDVRPTSTDAGEGHRRWKMGRGMVGMTFFAAQQLVVSDASTSELEGVMRDSDEEQAQRDREAYKSVAAVPIYGPDAFELESEEDSVGAEPEIEDGDPPLFGVVVATSNAGNRFTNGREGELSLTALAAVAEAMTMVLIAAGFPTALTNDSSHDGNGAHGEGSNGG